MDTISLKHFTSIILFNLLMSIYGFSQYKTNVIITDLLDQVLASKMQQNASILLTEFNTAFSLKRKPDLSNNFLTANARKSINSLWEMSMFRCYETQIIEKGIIFMNKYEIRNIPLFFQEASDSDHYEEGVLLFNENGLIDDIYISVGTNRVNEIQRSHNSVTDLRRREIIVDFIENFRTAYNRKDTSFLEKVFSQDALIITGRVVKVQKQPKDMMQMNIQNEKIIYQRQTKSEYLSKMKIIFNHNSYINIKFEEIEVVQHGKYPEIYGVTIKQYWNTSRYSDIGYVFLMIDFKDEDNPIIHVRTWQPENYNGKSISKDDVFSLGSFGNYNR